MSSQEAYQIRKGGGPPERKKLSLGHSLEQPSTIATTRLKDKKRVGELRKKKQRE